MAQTVCILDLNAERERLRSLLRFLVLTPRQFRRVRVIEESMDGLDASKIARRCGVSRPTVWRWQHRYAQHGIASLLRRPAPTES